MIISTYIRTLAAVFLLPISAMAASGTPNIIFIVTDDHGYNDLEATDLHDEVDMPNIHKLSTEGALMTQAYCTAPQCVPSRAGIVTGRYNSALESEGMEKARSPLRKSP